MSDRRRLIIAMILWGCGEGCFLYSWPIYLAHLGAGPVQVGLVYAISSAVAALANLPGGHLADRYGRRGMILSTMLLAVPAPLIYAVVPSWQWALPGVVLYGASFAFLPAVSSYLVALHEDDAHAQAGTATFGTVFGSFSLGLVLTPWLSGQIAAHLGERWQFPPAAICFLASTAIAWRLRPQPLHAHAEVSGRAIGALLANRRYLLLCAGTGVVALCIGLTLPFAVPYAQQAAHLGDAWVGLLGSSVALGEFTLGMALGPLSLRLGRMPVLALLLGLYIVSLTVLLSAPGAPVLVLAFLLRGAFAPSASLLTVLLGQSLSPKLMGAGFGVWETIFQVGMIVSAYAGGVLYAWRAGMPFIVAMCGLLFCIVALPALRPRWQDLLQAPAAAAVPRGLGEPRP